VAVEVGEPVEVRHEPVEVLDARQAMPDGPEEVRHEPVEVNERQAVVNEPEARTGDVQKDADAKHELEKVDAESEPVNSEESKAWDAFCEQIQEKLDKVYANYSTRFIGDKFPVKYKEECEKFIKIVTANPWVDREGVERIITVSEQYTHDCKDAGELAGKTLRDGGKLILCFNAESANDINQLRRSMCSYIVGKIANITVSNVCRMTPEKNKRLRDKLTTADQDTLAVYKGACGEEVEIALAVYESIAQWIGDGYIETLETKYKHSALTYKAAIEKMTGINLDQITLYEIRGYKFIRHILNDDLLVKSFNANHPCNTLPLTANALLNGAKFMLKDDNLLESENPADKLCVDKLKGFVESLDAADEKERNRVCADVFYCGKKDEVLDPTEHEDTVLYNAFYELNNGIILKLALCSWCLVELDGLESFAEAVLAELHCRESQDQWGKKT
jgi:hypothetical protein